jgi:putative addiction module killer protein
VRLRKSNVFIKWLNKLKDKIGKHIITSRVSRLEEGNFGDCYPVGDGVTEMRIHYGPGYRVYFLDSGKEIIILLCGGDKSSQQADIKKAKKIAKLYKE